MASGVRIFLPSIPGVGILRTRWPIMPVHGEGNSVWKELNAIKDILMNQKAYGHMMWDGSGDPRNDSEWQMQVSKNNGLVKPHTHTIVLSPLEMSQLKGNHELEVWTSLDNGHQHKLKIRWNHKAKRIYYRLCSGLWYCKDKHPRDIFPLNVDEKVLT